jgi:hypothetical protein
MHVYQVTAPVSRTLLVLQQLENIGLKESWKHSRLFAAVCLAAVVSGNMCTHVCCCALGIFVLWLAGWDGVLPDFSSINIQVFKPDGSSAGISANDYNSDEQVNLENAPSGTYTVEVTADTEETVNFKIHVWYLNFAAGTSASTATLASSPTASAPATAVSGAPLKVDLTFAKSLDGGSAAGQRHLGAVLYSRRVGSVFRRLQQVRTLVSLV